MDSAESTPELNRRQFLQATAGAAAAVALPGLAAGTDGSNGSTKKMIGIQVGAVSFADEGVEQVLDVFQQKGAVNTVFLTTFTYGRGLSGRQIAGQPFPDHGCPESDAAFYHGGNYAKPHAEFYEKTVP